MNFLYPAFLIGALAVAIPIALHFLRRDIAPEVPFSAVRLLHRSPVARSKRRRLRDLLLLAARVVALLLLAAAFARPYVAGAAGSTQVRLVAIDRSFSMGAPGRFAHALDLARRAIDEASPGERVGVIAFDDGAEILAEPGSAGQAKAALANLQAGFGGTRYGALLAKAADAATGGPARLIVVTDLQRAVSARSCRPIWRWKSATPVLRRATCPCPQFGPRQTMWLPPFRTPGAIPVPVRYASNETDASSAPPPTSRRLKGRSRCTFRIGPLTRDRLPRRWRTAKDSQPTTGGLPSSMPRRERRCS
jgi:hypothetical protein